MEKRCIAVITSDVHYNVNTLPLAHASTTMALKEAEKHQVPLVIAGDLLDTKAIIRGECANALITLFSAAKTKVFILVGNHSLLNEKGKDHALHFLSPYAEIISSPKQVSSLGWLLPYFNSSSELTRVLSVIPKNSRLIMHQGVIGAEMGHYVKDSTSLPQEAFADFRVISGHYHKAQDIKCGRPRKGAIGLFSYIGNPYTLSFAEANDGSKGFRVLYDDGTLGFVPTNLRKHVIIDTSIDCLENLFDEAPGENDLVWLKVRGPYSELEKLKKADVAKVLGLKNFKLDKIPNDSQRLETSDVKNVTAEQMMDKVIDATPEATEHKTALKSLWREIVS